MEAQFGKMTIRTHNFALGKANNAIGEGYIQYLLPYMTGAEKLKYVGK